jgi:hypothetical protein
VLYLPPPVVMLLATYSQASSFASAIGAVSGKDYHHRVHCYRQHDADEYRSIQSWVQENTQGLSDCDDVLQWNYHSPKFG